MVEETLEKVPFESQAECAIEAMEYKWLFDHSVDQCLHLVNSSQLMLLLKLWHNESLYMLLEKL